MTNGVNAADKTTATQTVQSGGFLWLNPISRSVVNCNRAEEVVWSRYDIFVDGRKIQSFQDFCCWAEKRDRPI